MAGKRVLFFTAFLIGLGFFPGPVTGAEEGEAVPQTGVRTEEGIHFRLPEDWPIVKRHGVLMPLPIDEYLSQKMQAMMTRLDAAEEKTAVMMKILEAIDRKMDTLMERLSEPEEPEAAQTGEAALP